MKKVKQPTPARSASPRGQRSKEAPAPGKRAATKPAAGPSAGPRKGVVARATKRVAPKRGTQVKGRPARAGAAPVTPPLAIRELDPVRICGDRTSVIQLFRVDETVVPNGKAASSRQVHLVFNDRHGWYCEHGRSCHAVSAVMRHAGIR